MSSCFILIWYRIACGWLVAGLHSLFQQAILDNMHWAKFLAIQLLPEFVFGHATIKLKIFDYINTG
jgi:hypothetical protein